MGTTVAAVTLAGLAMAPAAHAGNTTCSADSTTSSYFGDCNRDADDGDAGGVSGDAGVVRHNASGVEASAYFSAKSEWFYGYNQDMDRKMRFRLYWKDSSGRMHTAVDQYLGAGVNEDWHVSLPEGVKVGIDVSSSSTGRAALNSLRA
ncbi:hypothetical protein [Streptomyces sp. NEAU-YJ-81]|uniref:hypothetical protein n=1 Tax=Streptomyces sp. NEAU-YJ-81 TaxID=2820288 RepID=UPI001ABC98CF|nr:hypothetical protein [Streptomyces sp. NEAU-YJ-81]MBO3673847.1 hypothetical protein [Streptomyces sp. NEAU-YJ-81]